LAGNYKGKKFEQILLEAVDEAFLALGEPVKASIYSHLAARFIVPRQDIPYRIDDFSDALEKIFGAASKQLEILIMKTLHSKINAYSVWNGPNWLIPNITFAQYIEMARVCFEEGAGKIGELEVYIDAEKQKQRA
jgi:hypothetical protein